MEDVKNSLLSQHTGLHKSFDRSTFSNVSFYRSWTFHLDSLSSRLLLRTPTINLPHPYSDSSLGTPSRVQRMQNHQENALPWPGLHATRSCAWHKRRTGRDREAVEMSKDMLKSICIKFFAYSDGDLGTASIVTDTNIHERFPKWYCK
jgi:hypothetical protein